MLEKISPQSRVNPVTSRPNTSGQDEQKQTAAASESNRVNRRHSIQNDSSDATSSESDSVKISQEARELVKLVKRDREVKAHEAAHAAIGGQYAGSPALTYTKGPDGRSYATSGEVSIDLSPVSGDPQATLQKAEIIRAAALAPVQPSAKDLRIAARATVMASEARSELVNESSEKITETQGSDKKSVSELDPETTSANQPSQQNRRNSGPSAAAQPNG